ADLFYVGSTGMFLAASAVALWQGTSDVRRRVVLSMSFFVLGASVLLLAASSLIFDFDDSWAPSRASPYFVAGRLAGGALVPFMARSPGPAEAALMGRERAESGSRGDRPAWASRDNFRRLPRARVARRAGAAASLRKARIDLTTMPLSRLHGLTARTAANLWIVAFFAFSLWLRAGHPIQALGDAAYDDLLFVRLADFIGSGQWLGPYDHLTMAKGAAYSLFMAINQRTGIPLKLAEQLMYLVASATFVTSIRRVCPSNRASVAIFAVLALNPQPWTPDVGGRVVRENLYTSLSLLGLALAIRICVQRPGAAVTRELAASWPLLALLGLVGGLYWLTREEGSWLLPALALLALYWTAANAPRIRESRAQVAAAAAFLAVPLACFSLVVGTVD